MVKVYNKRYDLSNIPNTVYVGRPSDFGNPFSLKYNTRKGAIDKFRTLIENNEEFVEKIKKELKGKNLVCWCSPLPCHADVLLEIANK